MPDVTDPDNDADIWSFGGVLLADALEGQSAERDFEERSADDLHIIYTGGTTGFPKGVMWRHEDFWRVLGGGIDFYTGEPLEEYDQSKQANDPRMVTFPLSPLMHGGAQAGLLMHLFAGHLTILEPKFDATRTWGIIEREGVQLIFMTGDAMARPLIEEFERKASTGTPYDASSLFAVSSSAAVFSPPVKERWMAAFPNTVFTDSVGASETGFQGMGLQDKDHISTDGPVVGLGPNSVVIDDDNHVLDLARTSVRSAGSVAAAPCRSATSRIRRSRRRTFLEIDGERYSVPGDFARIEADNKVTLLGRGSNCINTGGEKVYPEEVEMAIKAHPDVYDVLVVGIPDERYGQSVTAVIQPARRPRSSSRSCARSCASLSGYKLPRAITLVEPRSRATPPARRSTPRPRSWRWPRAARSPPHRRSLTRCAPTCATGSASSTRSSPSPPPSTSPPRSRGPADSACSAASGSTTPRSSTRP